jgi:hypothetical protein
MTLLAVGESAAPVSVERRSRLRDAYLAVAKLPADTTVTFVELTDL